jgi:hypothetical protein
MIDPHPENILGYAYFTFSSVTLRLNEAEKKKKASLAVSKPSSTRQPNPSLFEKP